MSKWELAEAIALARALEQHFEGQFHVALAGSVLHKGKSEKDVDLFIYPHKAYTFGTSQVYAGLRDFGMVCAKDHKELQEAWTAKAEKAGQEEGYTDSKYVSIWKINGKRVDIFVPWAADEMAGSTQDDCTSSLESSIKEQSKQFRAERKLGCP